MKRVFISCPMNGKTDAEIREAREHGKALAEKELKEPVEIIDSLFEPNDKPLKLLARALALLADADVAVFTNGWSEARGCVIEHTCAEQYGIGYVITEGH